MTHLLVTNDFPPKVGGIQAYLWELWRRLPSHDFVVLTSPYAGTAAWDAEQPFRIVRTREPVLLPHPWMARRIDALADEIGADLVVLDPAVPLGIVGPSLRHRYAVVLHGAEVTVPGRLPGTAQLLGRVLRRAELVVAAGGYPAAEAERAAGRPLPTVVIPPGVDTSRFVPPSADERSAARARFAVDEHQVLVAGLSRLVPRKGFDVLIQAAAIAARHRPHLTVAISGSGRDRNRLAGLIDRHRAPVRLLGRVSDEDKLALYRAADVFAMLCRSRWGGLEQEGFGIVFVEAAACGVAQLAGQSGGAAEAVIDAVTGLVVRHPSDPEAVAAALVELVDDPGRRAAMGSAARARALTEFDYDVLAGRLHTALAAVAPPSGATTVRR